MADCDDGSCTGHDPGEGSRVGRQTPAADRRDECGTGRESHGVDEHRKAERPDRLVDPQPPVDRAEGDAGEEDGGNAEAEAPDLDTTEEEAGACDGEEQQGRILYEQVDHDRSSTSRGEASAEVSSQCPGTAR